ncbi:hypothetical protein Gotur_009812, partial [Gossypium turneri]
MGTRKVYKEKLRNGNLYHDLTINPGLGFARCPRCLSLLIPDFDKAEWTITSVLHDATAVDHSFSPSFVLLVGRNNNNKPQCSNLQFVVTCMCTSTFCLLEVSWFFIFILEKCELLV